MHSTRLNKVRVTCKISIIHGETMKKKKKQFQFSFVFSAAKTNKNKYKSITTKAIITTIDI